MFRKLVNLLCEFDDLFIVSFVFGYHLIKLDRVLLDCDLFHLDYLYDLHIKHSLKD